MNGFIFLLQAMLLFFLSLILTALSEVFWHKFLFHSKKTFLNRLLTRLWNYDISRHDEHHIICRESMRDDIKTIESYRVQKLTNVYAAAFIAFAIQCFFVWILDFSNIFYLISFFTIYGWFTFWFKFEDHFHTAMHKPDYYEMKIKNTWQDKWFLYLKHLHTIHHRAPNVNFAFIFPFGDRLLGTYRHSYEHYLNLKKRKK